MKTILRKSMAVLLTASLVACASNTATVDAPRGNPRVITLEQIQTNNATNALDLVRSLRPSWLQKRGQQSINFEGDIVVYFDHIRFGGPEALRSIPISGLARIEYFDAAAATQRWGTGHTHGVIAVFTRG
jgi:hypothetical protein